MSGGYDVVFVRLSVCLRPCAELDFHVFQSSLSISSLSMKTYVISLQNGTTPMAIAASPNGEWLAVFGADFHLRVFGVRRAKLSRVYLETLQVES